MSDWKPIASAPKDGTRFIACRAGFEPQVVRWNSGKWCSFDQEDFDEVQQWYEWFGNTEYHPTHWMPLPPSPAAPKEGE